MRSNPLFLVPVGFIVAQGVLAAVLTKAQEPGSALEVERTVAETVEIAQRTQHQQDSWASERADLEARYRDLKAQVAYLSERKEIESERAAALQAEVDEFTRRLEESARLEAGLEDTLFTVYRELEQQVGSDLPFLPQERSLRLEHLRRDLVRPGIEGAEKLRRLLEALLVEAAYGSDFEVYTGSIQVGSDSLTVGLLRLGRLAVFWQTPDGKRAGGFDAGTGKWTTFDSAGRHRIGLAMEMANRRRAHDIVLLSLGRVVQ